MASGDLIAEFWARDCEPDTTATPDTRNGQDVLDFDSGGAEYATFRGILHDGYSGGGITVDIVRQLSSATSGNDEWETSFERIGTVLDTDTDSFASPVNSGDEAVPATSGIPGIVTNAHTDGAQIDSLAAGEEFRIKVQATVPSTSTASGDRELRCVRLTEA